ncbi:archaellin/type IV pilin N-terminal domain-containing protein [Halorubrum distributum]|uniref:archaellin/type IV pilin N-terminal domain-containing protein n=1 Tax=Halorubrum distributum TaxID=29283 RepID=UPI00295551D3|nr:archaellin/type IV pilin N-terminal domain-containing protein [Halorubrum distributum]MDV7350404.1 archaellin/type IV pilin N-terminal domain-containing protein [Halorubrum distributum]
MFESITNTEERGQVGIGTLIVFIAMVLVAAIAAGVLINTAGFLQSQAEATGQESTDLVSERIDVKSAVGIVTSNSDDGELAEIRIGVAGSAGADEIDLSETTIQAVGPNGQSNLVFANASVEIGNADADATAIPEDSFGVRNSTGSFVDDPVINDDEQFTIVLNPQNEPFGNPSESEVFGESDQSSIDIVSPSSATTSVELRAPDLFSNDGEAVRL